MFQVKCKPLRDMNIEFNRTKLPAQAWKPVLQAILKHLQHKIISSPLIGQYDSDKPIFLKTDWSTIGMSYMLLQPGDNSLYNDTIKNLRKTGECDFDILTKTGPQLWPILFNGKTCTDTEKHYHGFVGEISCCRWDIAKDN